MTKSEIAIKYLKQYFPKKNISAIAAIMLSENPGVWKTHDAVRHVLRDYKHLIDTVGYVDTNKEFPEPEVKPISEKIKYEETKDSATIDGSFSSDKTDRVKILEDFLTLTKVDLYLWEVERYILNAWDVTMKNAEQIGSSYTNYQIKVWLKRKLKSFNAEEFKKQIIADIKKHSPRIKVIPRPQKQDDNLLVINLWDIHFGRLCWGDESDGNYDAKIAERLVMECLNGLIEKSNGFSFSKILLTTGQDFLNYDYAKPFPQTTAGTPQESDVRWQKMFQRGYLLWFKIIDYLKTLAPVDVVNIPGNHEEQTMFYLGEVMAIKYNNDANVNVDNRPKSRKYYRFYDNLIGLAHGKNEKVTEISNNMLTDKESQEYIGICPFKYYYLGHGHHEKQTVVHSQDHKGVLIEQLPSIAQTDAWEFAKCYQSVRGATAMIHNKTHGRIAKFNHNLI